MPMVCFTILKSLQYSSGLEWGQNKLLFLLLYLTSTNWYHHERGTVYQGGSAGLTRQSW